MCLIYIAVAQNDVEPAALAQMASPLNTYIQRLADVYLMKAEAILGNNESTSDPEALAAFDAVHNRARVEAVHPTSITLMDLIRERRIEFCMEYFNWWDMVTWYRWKPQTMLNFFNRQQHRAFEIRENSLYRNSNGTFSYRVIPPGTGGRGIGMFTIGGLTLMLAAAILLYTHSKRRKRGSTFS